jgi:hypothetical protein
MFDFSKEDECEIKNVPKCAKCGSLNISIDVSNNKKTCQCGSTDISSMNIQEYRDDQIEAEENIKSENEKKGITQITNKNDFFYPT